MTIEELKQKKSKIEDVLGVKIGQTVWVNLYVDIDDSNCSVLVFSRSAPAVVTGIQLWFFDDGRVDSCFHLRYMRDDQSRAVGIATEVFQTKEEAEDYAIRVKGGVI